MAEGNNVLLGILAIILGILLISFPLIGVFAASVITGLGIIFLGIWLIAHSFGTWDINKAISIASLVLGIIGIVVGIGLFGKVIAFSIFAGMMIYLGGFFLIMLGVIDFLSGVGSSPKAKGAIGIIMGILFILIGLYAFNPIYLGSLIGVFLLIQGLFAIFMPAE
ncbi:DUF308 domain-containing protein [Methanobacterium alcaliphilum]|uniref:DUF308 domain-containing protein n=1 Tax=Methanobacterium alcaliphilum TaxID=392018 RepID=UPI002009FF8F|nr:DUF308 domain-containing protein [Methanobacterium alcaliphilum]MCK9151918.1 DUF308 domain-containing protein [Methanobacterium alcaliphilum]